MIRWTILSMAVFAASGAAEAQQSAGLEVYVDIDKTRALITTPAEVQQFEAGLATLRASATSLQSQLSAKMNEMTRNQLVWDANQMAREKRAFEVLQEQLVSATRSLEAEAGFLRDSLEGQQDSKIRSALGDYVAQNRFGVVVSHRSGAAEDDIIVLNPQFELATALSEMVKSGPGAFAPAHPGRAPVVKYVDIDELMRVTGGSDELNQEQEQILAGYRSKDRSLRDDLTKWSDLRPFSDGRQQSELMVELIDLKLKDLRIDTDAAFAAARERHWDRTRQSIADFVANNPDVIRADALRLATWWDSTVFADPSLDVTTVLKQAMKARQ
jgi:hypothetical protein